jgi:hypothetical protein
MTEVHSCSFYCDRPECIKAQRDELRDRLAQPEQKPVPWESFFNRYCPWLDTAPPQHKPLTDEQIAEALGFGEHTTATTRAILTHAARAIEAKIKENT